MCSNATPLRRSLRFLLDPRFDRDGFLDSEVRRAALLNTPLTAASLPLLLTRTRDTDPITRKLMYSVVLRLKLQHPRQLTLAQREQIVKDGLGDREPGVRLAAGKMIATWFDTMTTPAEGEDNPGQGAVDISVVGNLPSTRLPEDWEGDDGGVMKAFLSFLGLFDVFGPGEAIAVDAILSIFVTRPDVLSAFIFHGTSVYRVTWITHFTAFW